MGWRYRFNPQYSKKNYDEIPELVAFANEMGARVFNLFFLVCTGRGQDITDITSEQYEAMILQKLQWISNGYMSMWKKLKNIPLLKNQWPMDLCL